MGQKVHPVGFRLGILTQWESNWYAEKDFARLLQEDLKIRKYVKKKLYHAGISKITIERTAAEDLDTIREVFESDTFRRLEATFQRYVTNYTRKVVAFREGFQFIEGDATNGGR